MQSSKGNGLNIALNLTLSGRDHRNYIDAQIRSPESVSTLGRAKFLLKPIFLESIVPKNDFLLGGLSFIPELRFIACDIFQSPERV